MYKYLSAYSQSELLNIYKTVENVEQFSMMLITFDFIHTTDKRGSQTANERTIVVLRALSADGRLRIAVREHPLPSTRTCLR